MSKDKIIMFNSDEAAEHRTDIKGWVSRNGLFFGDGKNGESAAKYDGCTHRPCLGCGAPAKKMWTHCYKCREEADIKAWREMPAKKWEEDIPVYSRTLDKYFYDESQVMDHIEENGGTVEDLRLVLCQPVKLREVEDDYWEEALTLEDGYADLPAAVSDALDKLNRAIREARPVSWEPGIYRVEL